MKRFLLALTNEFRLARTAIPIHLVAIIQPTVMYLLMAVILVDPTFSMNVVHPDNQIGRDFVEALEATGSPIGKPYVRINWVEKDANTSNFRQLLTIENQNEQPTAMQSYGLIDSNIVKNYRNRQTAAALKIWNNDLGSQAVTIEEYPWLPQDISYKVYFGMALLPMAAMAAASIIGAILTAQEFEHGTILQYRLAPASAFFIVGSRLTRLILTSFIGAAVLLVAVGIQTGFWPASLWKLGVIILPVGLIGGGLGMMAGLLLEKSIPSFMIALIASFLSWIIGNSFGLATGFGGGYAFASLFSPNAYAVELLFPLYFGISVGNPSRSMALLALMGLGTFAMTLFVYRQRVVKRG